MTVIVRPSTLRDANHIVAGINAICAERLYFQSARYDPTPEWEAVLKQERPGNSLLLVAHLGDAYLGSAQVLPMRSCPGCGELGIGILRPFREQGIGAALMNRAITDAGRLGYEQLQLRVLASNTRAINLYRRWGFRPQRDDRNVYAYLGEQDERIMSRALPR